MKVAIISESFLPQVNGVTNSVLRVLEHLQRRGHEAVVVAPGPADRDPDRYAGAPVLRLPSLPLPGYPEVRISAPGVQALRNLLIASGADVVHLASPFALGPSAVRAAQRADVPVVAVFQTDVAGFARHYGAGALGELAWRRLERVHRQVDRTLAPSRATVRQLRRRGIPRVQLWPRGVDTARFHPQRRMRALRDRLAPRGEVLVGYVGRLAPEKRVSDLVVLAGLPGVRLVVIGEGPSRGRLQRLLPDAAFLGFLDGDRLPAAVASLDVMVHAGVDETFCQSVQEALASGVPVVAAAAGGPWTWSIPAGRAGCTPPVTWPPCATGFGTWRATRPSDGPWVPRRASRSCRGAGSRSWTRCWTTTRTCDPWRGGSGCPQLPWAGEETAMRIVMAANFYSETSGGLRTTLHALGRGYRARGHEPVLVVPGERAADEDTPFGRRITLAAPVLPGSGGYRVMTDLDRVCGALDDVRPDRLEVSDRLSMRGLGWWARASGVPSVLWAHERVDGVIRSFARVPVPARVLADRHNRVTAHRFDTIVCSTAYAAEEFVRIGVRDVVQVPLGVDLGRFHPQRRDARMHRRHTRGHDYLAVVCSRLSREKRVDLAVDAVRVLQDRGVDVRLVVAGTGPLRHALYRRARRLPVDFLGYVSDGDRLAALLASADVVLAPGPIETFGLAALEALASGTPVVASRTSALAEIVLGEAGAVADPDPYRLATAVESVLARPLPHRRESARQRAESFPWSRTVDRMLALHQSRTAAGITEA